MPDVTLEELKQSVAALADAVKDRAAGAIDEEKVTRIVTEVLERQAKAIKDQNDRKSVEADDALETAKDGRMPRDLKARAAKVLQLPARRAALLSGRPVEVIEEFHRASDRLVIASAVLERSVDRLSIYEEEFVPAMRALSSGASTSGVEYIPRQLSGSLIERVNLELKLAALFRTVPMPTNPFDIAAKGVSRRRLGKAAEQTADTGQTGFKKVTPLTRKVTLSAAKFAGEMLFSKDADEDAIIALLGFTEEELIDYLTADIEDTLLNGDTTGTHMDSDVTSSDDPRKNWVGLRKWASTETGTRTDGGNVALTPAMLRTNRKKMGKYGVKPADLVNIVGIAPYIQLLGDATVQTIDKYGQNATVLTGELAKVDGVPIIVSEYARGDLNASGVYDGTTTNRSSAQTVNTKGFLQGERRGVEMQVLREVYAEYDQDAVMVTTRRAFSNVFPSTENVVAETYNIATSA